MLLYIAIIFFLIFALLIDIRNAKTVGVCKVDSAKIFQRHAAIVILLFLWFLTAFRSTSIGNDTPVYVRYFQNIDSYGVDENYAIEMGFQFLIRLIGKFTDDPHIFLVVMATINYGLLSYIIFKNSENCLISLILTFFLCYGSFCNIIRQSLAMLICFIAYIKFKNNRIILFVGLVLFAALFHTSALVVLLLLLYKYIPKNGYFIVGACCVAILLSHTSFLINISHMLGDEYTGYFTGKYANSGYLGTFLSLLRLVLIYFVIRSSSGDRQYLSEKEYNIVYTSSFFALFFLCCGFTVNIISRISDYFVIFSIIEIPNALKKKVGNQKNIFFAMLLAYMIVHFIVVQIFRPEWNHLYPYSLWN